MNRWTLAVIAVVLLAAMAVLGQDSKTVAAAPAPQITTAPSRSAGKGLVQEGGTIRVNPMAIRTYLTGSASLAFGAIAQNGGCSSRPIPVTGAVIGDKVVVGPPAELLTYSLAMTYAVTASDTVTIRLCNYTPQSITAPSWTWNVDVVKSF
jgi:hypothetical protein